MDVIIAVDTSADTKNFPDGQEIYHTYQKSLLPGYQSFAPFPVIPAPEEFVALGLNSRPVFFGSGCSNSTTAPKTPLIVCKLIRVTFFRIEFGTDNSSSILQPQIFPITISYTQLTPQLSLQLIQLKPNNLSSIIRSKSQLNPEALLGLNV